MIIPAGFGQANFIYSGNGYLRGAEVTIGFDDNTGDTPADIAATLIGIHTATITPVQGLACELLTVKVKLGPNATGPEATVGAGVNGTEAGNTLPPNIGVLMTKQTAVGGRKNKGKSFWPGATEAQTDGAGKLNAGAITDWLSAVQDFYDALVTATAPMVILHSDVLDTPTAVIGVTVSQLMVQQHRRLRRP